jgi:hypothetical protein
MVAVLVLVIDFLSDPQGQLTTLRARLSAASLQPQPRFVCENLADDTYNSDSQNASLFVGGQQIPPG